MMRPLWKDLLVAVWIGMILPGIALNAFVWKERHGQLQPVQVQRSQSVSGNVRFVPVRDPDGTCISMELDSYLTGVLLAEMPASFHEEALQAQAVAARTYAMKTCQDGKKHGGAICTSSECCQGYMSTEAYLLRGWNQKYILRVQNAVEQTRGQVLTYEGRLIRATYFSCSGGATESAVAVWGRDYPYLQSVKSPGEEETVYYTDTKAFSTESFQEALGISLTGNPETWFGTITYTDGGGIDHMMIGGTEYRGTTLRALLGLRSTVFYVVVSDDGILFETKGFGHRVGMSQYGADAMAQEGHDYRRILQHYYQGTEIFQLEAPESP